MQKTLRLITYLISYLTKLEANLCVLIGLGTQCITWASILKCCYRFTPWSGTHIQNLVSILYIEGQHCQNRSCIQYIIFLQSTSSVFLSRESTRSTSDVTLEWWSKTEWRFWEKKSITLWKQVFLHFRGKIEWIKEDSILPTPWCCEHSPRDLK